MPERTKPDTVPIPAGYREVKGGSVQVGDLVYADATKRFIEVDEGTLNQLGFLDARSVDECICVARRE